MHGDRLSREYHPLLRFAIPVMLGQLAQIGMTIVDNILASHLGPPVVGSFAVGGTRYIMVLIALLTEKAGQRSSSPASARQDKLGLVRLIELGGRITRWQWLPRIDHCLKQLSFATRERHSFPARVA